jgi:hypothetical protein
VPDPLIRGYHGRNEKAEKDKRQEIEANCDPGSIDGIDGYAKSDQHGRRHGGLGRGAAWASRRQTFLTQSRFSRSSAINIEVSRSAFHFKADALVNISA